MSTFVIGIDCPNAGVIKDIRMPYDPRLNSVTTTIDSSGKITKLKISDGLIYVDIKRVVYVYIAEDNK